MLIKNVKKINKKHCKINKIGLELQYMICVKNLRMREMCLWVK